MLEWAERGLERLRAAGDLREGLVELPEATKRTENSRDVENV